MLFFAITIAICEGNMTIEEILRLSQKKKASDIHMSPGSPLMFRIDGAIVPQTEKPLTPNETWTLISSVMHEDEIIQLKEKGELDFAFSLPGLSRIRVNVFRQRGTYAAALRILSYETPTPEKLGIPYSVVNLTHKKRGLILVTGATGSGKSTTLASLIGVISARDSKNIITLEDPIEYLHPHKKCIVSQREVGSDTYSYSNALKAALREDPDVILVGEMRDLETIAIAITAAETGHLVFSTLHTNSAADSIDRMIDVFPPHQQQQIRVQLSGVIEGVITQQLLPKLDGRGRLAAYEVMLATYAIRNLIREGKTYQIPSMLQTGRKDGMQTMDDAIYELYIKRQIDEETAMRYAFDLERMKERIRSF